MNQKDAENPAKIQLFATTIINKSYIVGLNSVVFNDDNPKEVQEALIRAITTLKGYSEPIKEDTLNKYYNEDIVDKF